MKPKMIAFIQEDGTYLVLGTCTKLPPGVEPGGVYEEDSEGVFQKVPATLTERELNALTANEILSEEDALGLGRSMPHPKGWLAREYSALQRSPWRTAFQDERLAELGVLLGLTPPK